MRLSRERRLLAKQKDTGRMNAQTFSKSSVAPHLEDWGRPARSDERSGFRKPRIEVKELE
jgi:hypothetical protein